MLDPSQPISTKSVSIDLPGAAAEERLVEEIVGEHALKAQRRLG